MEHVSLRYWAEQLHQLQTEGKIDRDVLIFINFDADAEFWTGADLPWHLDWLPNTGGLGQLVDSVAGLPFVTFTKLSDYLADHPPVGTVRFSQDTADGSFDGYHSWAEKAAASDDWTRILRNRRACETARKMAALAGKEGSPPAVATTLEAAFALRLRALSTTNFGLAAPFLARQREAVLTDLLARLDETSDRLESYAADLAERLKTRARPFPHAPENAQLVETFVHLNRTPPGVPRGDLDLGFTLPVTALGGRPYVIVDTRGRRFPAVLAQKGPAPQEAFIDVSLRVSKAFQMPDGVYFLYRQTDQMRQPDIGSGRVYADKQILKNEFLSVRFDAKGFVTAVTRNGKPVLEAGSLIPRIVHQGRHLRPERLDLTVEAKGEDGIAVVRLHGPWKGPSDSTRAAGWVDYRLRLLRGVPYLFVDGKLAYPDTRRRQVLQADKPVLARKINAGWEAVAPLELRFAARASRQRPFVIHKRNYLGEESAYAVDYFRHSPRNLEVASINNHITSSYVGVTAADRGMAVAMDTTVQANFAFCPFKMVHSPERGTFAIRANPFGTYDGRQILPPTRGNRQGYEAVLLSAPQLRSVAPTYNGYRERFGLMIAFFEGATLPEAVKADLIAFAERPVLLGKLRRKVPAPAAKHSLPPGGFLALPYGEGVVFHWETAGKEGATYRLRCRAVEGSRERVFATETGTLYLQAAALGSSRGYYTATVETQDSESGVVLRSPEIRFRLGAPSSPEYAIPLDFKARILWANVNAWIRRLLL